MNKLFVKEKYLKDLLSIFEKYCPQAEIIAYGSRVGGDCHDGSDLDLAIKNLDKCEIKLYELKEILKNNITIYPKY